MVLSLFSFRGKVKNNEKKTVVPNNSKNKNIKMKKNMQGARRTHRTIVVVKKAKKKPF